MIVVSVLWFGVFLASVDVPKNTFSQYIGFIINSKFITFIY